MKKVLSSLLCLTMLVSLTACSSGDSAPAPSETPAAQTTAGGAADGTTAAQTESSQAAVSGEPVYINPDAANMTGTVRFWTAFDGQYGTANLIKDFNEYYPNITVEYNVYSNNTEGNLKVDTAMMAGELDALLSFNTYNTAARWENNMLLDLTDRLAADNLDLDAEWDGGGYLYNGRAYAIPSGGLSVFVAVNMRRWEEAGLGDLPTEWTWDEYIEACRKMTEKDASGETVVYGGTDFNQRDYWTYMLRQSKGVDALYNSEGYADFDNPLCAKIFQRYKDCEEEGIWFSKMDLISNNQKSRDLLWNENVASCVESIITRFVTDTEKYPHDFILGYAPYPINEPGETNYALGNMPNSFFCVPQNAQDPDAAYEFIKFASTYGGKYLYMAGHTTTWTKTDPNEIVDLVFGSAEEAAKWIDVDSYIANVLAVGAPAYHEERVTAYNEIYTIMAEYTDYILNGSMSIEEGLAEMNELCNEAIEEKMNE